MIDKICNYEDCTGCSACFNICPSKAISMLPNFEGFLYPVIDANQCTTCNVCIKTCPINGFEFEHPIEPECYAIMASDELRLKSTSGAVFPILAEHVLEKNGLVCGAGFDEYLNLHHVLVDRKEGLEKLKGSKYMQSHLGDVFSQIKQHLDNKRLVLFTGTPCQNAGLLKFLAKDYENLITVDFVCHGVPSQKVFQKYLSEISSKNNKVKSINFRDKRDGWNIGYYLLSIEYENGERIYEKSGTGDFINAFFANISLRTACHSCQFAKTPRVADFTMGDYWGARKDIDDKKGTSLLFLNAIKSVEIFNVLKDKFKLVKQRPSSESIQNQPNLRAPSARHPARKDFFNMLEKNQLSDSLSQNICSNKNVALLNFHWENVNFGAILTSFALNKQVNLLGYNAQNIDYYPSFPWIEGEPENPFFDDFRKKHIPRTRRFKYGESLDDLNNVFSTFIVGSDQVWRYGFIKNDLDVFFLSFADFSKNIVSYAASFGLDSIDANELVLNEYKSRLSLFDSISVREKSAVDICANLDIPSTHVLDPVFLLEENVWDEIIAETSLKKDSSIVVYYTINEKLENEILNFIKDKNDILPSNPVNITYKISVADWLWNIKNSDFIVTDSYHGVCFAIIFNKEFVCINPNIGTSTRMKSLLEQLGIGNRLYNKFDDIHLIDIINNPIDYTYVHEKLKVQKDASLYYLKESLENTISRYDEKKILYFEFLESQKLLAKTKIKPLFVLKIKYKILSKICFGSRRKKYKLKYKKVKENYKKMRYILKG